jgi:hypothetical protein
MQTPARHHAGRHCLQHAALAVALTASAAVLSACVDHGAAAPGRLPAGADTALASLRCTTQTQWRLYFGFDTQRDAPRAEAWEAFVNNEAAPRLPAGHTLTAATGTWRGAEGRVQQPASHVLEVLAEDRLALRQALADIASSYKARFDQQAVLITAIDVRVCR